LTSFTLQVTALIRFGTGNLTLFQAIQVYNLSWISVSSIIIGLGLYALAAKETGFGFRFDFHLTVIATAEIWFFFVASFLLWGALPHFKLFDPCVESTPFFIVGKSVNAATTGRLFNLILLTLSTIFHMGILCFETRKAWLCRKFSREPDGHLEVIPPQTVRFLLRIA
jgi:hypothetical protein